MKFKIRKWRVCLVGGKCNLIKLLMVDTLCQLSGWDQSSICSIVRSLRRSQKSNQLFGFSIWTFTILRTTFTLSSDPDTGRLIAAILQTTGGPQTALRVPRQL